MFIENLTIIFEVKFGIVDLTCYIWYIVQINDKEMEEKEIVFDEIKLGKFDFSGEVLFKYDVEREGDGFDYPIYSTVDIVSSEVIRLTKFDEDGDEVAVGESDFDEIYEQIVDLFYRQV